MALLIKTTGEAEEFKPANGIQFDLSEIQKIIDGYMECYPLVDGKIFVCNEDGKRLKLPVNDLATAIAHTSFCSPMLWDVVVGNVLIMTVLEMDGPEEEEKWES